MNRLLLKIRFYSKLIPSFILFCGCDENPNIPDYEYHYFKPTYNNIQILPTNDTFHFALNENTYNAIKSFNLFVQEQTEYLSIYDERSESINIFNFHTKSFIKRIDIKSTFPGRPTYKVVGYSKSLDSHYVTNFSKLYIINGNGQISNEMTFLKSPKNAYAKFDNSTPAVFKDNCLFASVRPYVKSRSVKALKNWKIIYKFDFDNDKATLNYNLPYAYHKNLYGFYFLNYNYCYNDREHFVFSFPADTNIYESDLASYHKAYFAKSKYQAGDILPISKKALEEDEGHKEFKLRDSYGPIFFDPFTKRYLRLARQRQSQSDYESRLHNQKQTIIVFDENLHIIGEFPFSNEYIFSSLFFSLDGTMYARVRPDDEYWIHFIRLKYNN